MAVNVKNWQELKKPNSLERKIGGDARRRAIFVAEPLERGFGMTLGNSLRRVLLSSLQGAAVTSLKIEGVLHEFSTSPASRGRHRLVLTVTQIALKMDGEAPAAAALRDGPATSPRADSTTGARGHQPRPLICKLARARSMAERRHREGICAGPGQPPADEPTGYTVDSLTRRWPGAIRSKYDGSGRVDEDKLTGREPSTITPEDASVMPRGSGRTSVQFSSIRRRRCARPPASMRAALGDAMDTRPTTNRQPLSLQKVVRLELSVRRAMPQERQDRYIGDIARDERRDPHPDFGRKSLKRSRK